MRRVAYPYGRYLLKEKNVTDVGPQVKESLETLGFSIVKYDEENEKRGTLVVAVNKKIIDLLIQKKPPGHLLTIIGGLTFDIPSFRDMDVESQRVGVELYLWPIDEGTLMELFILPYMEHFDKPEKYHVTQTEAEEITDWFLCEQIWEEIEPKLVAELQAELVHRRA
jgi:hypothetical protein